MSSICFPLPTTRQRRSEALLCSPAYFSCSWASTSTPLDRVRRSTAVSGRSGWGPSPYWSAPASRRRARHCPRRRTNPPASEGDECDSESARLLAGGPSHQLDPDFRRILDERDAQVPDVARLAGDRHALRLELGDLRVDVGRPPAEMIDRMPLAWRRAVGLLREQPDVRIGVLHRVETTLQLGP